VIFEGLSIFGGILGGYKGVLGVDRDKPGVCGSFDGISAATAPLLTLRRWPVYYGLMPAKNTPPPNHLQLPTGEIVSDPVKGDFLAIPLFGWVSLRKKTDTPLVMLTVLLIKSLEEPMPQGTLRIELPVLEETEAAVVAALERFGWDGRVWPVDDGWPSGSEDDETQVIELMSKAGLRATMTFPPGEQGIQAQPVSVQRARGPFLMPPLPEPEKAPNPVIVEKLQHLCQNHKLFHRPVKAATSEEFRMKTLAALSMNTNIMKVARKVQSACRGAGIEFEGLAARSEDLDKIAFRSLIDLPVLKGRLKRQAEEWGEDEGTLIRQFLKIALVRAAEKRQTAQGISLTLEESTKARLELFGVKEEDAATTDSQRDSESSPDGGS